MTGIEKLLSISSDALSRHAVKIDLPEFGKFGELGEQLKELLSQKNGFYAFESALHVFPAGPFEGEMTLSRWNLFGLWRHEYGDLAGDFLFFAEDAFGDQFVLDKRGVCSFVSETGEAKIIGKDLEEWAKAILENYGPLTGYPLMHKWQELRGPIHVGKRLTPKVPFVLGGKFEVANLYDLDSVNAMKFKGNLARQLKDLPDGADVRIRLIE